jgi:hypothetical protein
LSTVGWRVPFAEDRELFRITAANLEEHRDKLSDGQVALLKRYPDSYYLPIFPCRRIATYPGEVLDRVKLAAAEVRMVPSGNGLMNLNASTVPFPFPDSALEVIWNHITRYRGGSIQRTYTQIPVQANGAYDGPGRASDGLRTSDDLDSYNGAPDRYDWTLHGKREMYVAMNSYRLNSRELDYKDIIMPGHINPAHTRYELHRVWVVEATLKAGERHIYGRRMFYLDEDSWSIVLKDQYDGRGELWRISQAHGIYHYDAMVPWGAEVQNDMQSGRYLVTGLDNEVNGRAYVWNLEARASEFTPAALRRSGRR